MKTQMQLSSLLFILLFFAELSIAGPVIREANFYRAFEGKDYYTKADGTTKVDFAIWSSTMSADGKVVAIYGNTYYDSKNHRELLIHNVESTTEPVVINLPDSVGYFNIGAGLISNADGSRIFFIANDTEVYRDMFCMLNTATGAVSILLYTSSSDPVVEEPQCIATDSQGEYLYFNENDNGYGTGDLWRIQVNGTGVPEMLVDADTLTHPSGGVGKFIGQFDVSDDGQTIAFFINSRTEDATAYTDRELFVKTTSNIRFLTNNDSYDKGRLAISGDGSTIVYSNPQWMVTTPATAVEDQVHIEDGYTAYGNSPGITSDGSTILISSNPISVSSPSTYLVKTDGSSRIMVEPNQIDFSDAHLSDDGTRIFFKNRSYVYPNEWYNMTVGVFGTNLWPAHVPKVTDVNYPSDLFLKLENNESFDINISVSDPQGHATILDVEKSTLFPDGYEDRSGSGPVTVSPFIDPAVPGIHDLYIAKGMRGSAWPEKTPIMTARFAVEDENGNVSYIDTLIQPLFSMSPIYYLLLH